MITCNKCNSEVTPQEQDKRFTCPKCGNTLYWEWQATDKVSYKEFVDRVLWEYEQEARTKSEEAR